MTPEQLAEIEQRWAKATRGPWESLFPGRIVSHPETCAVRQSETFIDWICQVQTSNQPRWEHDAIAIASAPTDIALLLAEVRRLNRMVDKGVDYLEHSCCDAPQSFDCEEINRDCRDCWKEYLESEAAGNG